MMAYYYMSQLNYRVTMTPPHQYKAQTLKIFIFYYSETGGQWGHGANVLRVLRPGVGFWGWVEKTRVGWQIYLGIQSQNRSSDSSLQKNGILMQEESQSKALSRILKIDSSPAMFRGELCSSGEAREVEGGSQLIFPATLLELPWRWFKIPSMVLQFLIIFWWWLRHCSCDLVPICLLMILFKCHFLLRFFQPSITSLNLIKKSIYFQFSSQFQCEVENSFFVGAMSSRLQTTFLGRKTQGLNLLRSGLRAEELGLESGVGQGWVLELSDILGVQQYYQSGRYYQHLRQFKCERAGKALRCVFGGEGRCWLRIWGFWI